MRISTTGNALSLTFVLAYLPLALLRLTHMAGAGSWHGPMTGAMTQAGGRGWMMNGAGPGGWHAGGWQMAGYGYGAYGVWHVIFGVAVAYALGWYVAAVFVSLYRFFERRASNKPD